MHELTILKWAAGATNPLPQIFDIDEEFLLEATHNHRLEGRLLRRLKQESQPWAGQRILDELEERQLTNQSRAKRQLEVIKEIHREYSLSGPIMIVIKGYAPYFLLQDPTSLRFSWDVDLLSDDSNRMQEALSRLGYQWSATSILEAHHSPRAFRHDLDFSIDSYNYIPVWSYPVDNTSEELDPKANPGVWNQTGEPLHSEIHVGDLIEYSLTGQRAEAAPLTIPDTTMTVLIACAHLFTDFLQGLPGQFGRLSLGRLVEVNELCKRPDFDYKRFIMLVRKFNAFDSVQFTAELLLNCFGYDSLNTKKFTINTRKTWSRFYRSSFWLPPPLSYDELLIPRDPVSTLRHLLSEVGVNEVLATDYFEGITYWTDVDGHGTPLERVITRSIKGKRLPVGVLLSWSTGTLLMEIIVAGVPNAEDLICVELAGVPCYWMISQEGLGSGEGQSLGNNDNVSVTFNPTGYTLRVEFGETMLQGIDANDIPILLAVIRLAGGPAMRPRMGKLRAATLIPMSVVKK